MSLITSATYGLGCISTGCLIHLLSLAFTIYYTCLEFHDWVVVTHFVFDIVRLLFGLLVFVAIQMNTQDMQLQSTVRYFYAVSAVCCIGVMIASIVMLEPSNENCMTPTNNYEAWKQQLSRIIPSFNDNSCTPDSTNSNDPQCIGQQTLHNYRIMYQPRQWCKFDMSNSCTRLKLEINGMQRCLRLGGAGSFIPASEFSIWIDCVGDLSRALLFFLLYQSEEDNDYEPVPTGDNAIPMADAVSATLRKRRPVCITQRPLDF